MSIIFLRNDSKSTVYGYKVCLNSILTTEMPEYKMVSIKTEL